MNNTYVNILDSEEEKISNKVEQIFQTLESEGQNPKYQKYTEAYREQELQRIADSKVQELRNIRNDYINTVTKKIETTQMQIPEAKLTDNYKLKVKKYRLLSLDIKEQIQLLEETTNPDDFQILKGMIIELNPQHLEQIRKIQLPTQQDLQRQAIGMLKYRMADINSIPGMNISRKANISVGGLEYYCNTLLGIGMPPLTSYF